MICHAPLNKQKTAVSMMFDVWCLLLLVLLLLLCASL
jgi:hypothetical protein